MVNMNMKKMMRRECFMTKSTKKKTEAAQLVAVDSEKLSLGLKTTFEGVAMVFASIGVDADIPECITPSEKVIEKEVQTDDAKETGNDAGAVDPVSDTDDAVPSAVPEPVVTDDETSEPTDESAPEKVETADAAEEVKSAISLDDVTKVIVQKIKQDRGNNGKIGQILKTYGAAKVGELDPKKYEAFLTDVAAL